MSEYITPNYETISVIQKRDLMELMGSSLLNAFSDEDTIDNLVKKLRREIIMAEYIKREALLKWAREFYPNDLQFTSAVINAPAADVVEVVRCENCLFSREVDSKEPKYKCINICREGCTQWVGSDDYCSYGERSNE